MLIIILVITKHLKNYLGTFITKKTERKQNEFNVIISALESYTPRDNKYVEVKIKLLNNAKNFDEGGKKLLKGLKT